MSHIAPISSLLQDQVIQRTRYFMARGEALFSCSLGELPIRFDLRGRSSGMYRVRGRHREIRYNPWIFALHFDHCLENTVPHEVAHCVVDRLYGLARVRPHGPEWRRVMEAFGVAARATASLSLEGIPRRQGTQVAYRCGCGPVPLGIRRHRKVVSGEALYSCRRCGETLRREC